MVAETWDFCWIDGDWVFGQWPDICPEIPPDEPDCRCTTSPFLDDSGGG